MTGVTGYFCRCEFAASFPAARMGGGVVPAELVFFAAKKKKCLPLLPLQNKVLAAKCTTNNFKFLFTASSVFFFSSCKFVCSRKSRMMAMNASDNACIQTGVWIPLFKHNRKGGGLGDQMLTKEGSLVTRIWGFCGWEPSDIQQHFVFLDGCATVSYTHLTLPTNAEV